MSLKEMNSYSYIIIIDTIIIAPIIFISNSFGQILLNILDKTKVDTYKSTHINFIVSV